MKVTITVVGSPEKLTTWPNEPTVADLRADYTAAQSAHGQQSAKIADWLDQLHVRGVYKPQSRKGRSAVQPKLIRKQAEWRYSALTEPLLNTPEMFTVTPRTYQDREPAKQNSMVLNYQFTHQIDKVNFIDSYVRTAVNEGTVIVRVSWAYQERAMKRTVPVYSYRESTPEEAEMLAQAQEMPEDSLSEQVKESLNASSTNGRWITAEDTGETEEVTEIETVKNQPEINVCDYRNIVIDPTCGNDLSKAAFLVNSFEASKSDLEKAGNYKNLDKIMVSSTTDGQHQPKDESSFMFADEPRMQMPVYEYWGYWDAYGTGVTVPIVATWVGDVMIRLELNPYPDQEIPFVIVPYLPIKDSVYGEPDASLLGDNQRLVGALTRGMIDSMARSANAQMGMRKDMLDAVQKKKFQNGEDYEFNPGVDPRSGIAEHKYPELPASTFNMLQMITADSDSLTGIKSFSTGLTGDAMGTTATGVNSAMSAQGKRELNILRRLGSGIQKIGQKILSMNSAFLSDEEIIRITDEEFVVINREDLQGAFDITLGISTAETDQKKAQELSFMLQTMGPTLPFDLTKIILSEIARLGKMPDLAKNIDAFVPQPDPAQQAAQKLELQKLLLENQKLQAEIQKISTDTREATTDSLVNLAKARNLEADTQMKTLTAFEEGTGITQQREVEQIEAQAKSNLKRDMFNTVFTQATGTNQQ